MLKISLYIPVICLAVLSVCFASDNEPSRKLIRVKLDEPQVTQPVAQPQVEQAYDPYPSPSDQLYVFWIAGRILSLPFDAAERIYESYVKSRPKEGSPVKASAPARPNPFRDINYREIPPAAPIER